MMLSPYSFLLVVMISSACAEEVSHSLDVSDIDPPKNPWHYEELYLPSEKRQQCPLSSASRSTYYDLGTCR